MLSSVRLLADGQVVVAMSVVVPRQGVRWGLAMSHSLGYVAPGYAR